MISQISKTLDIAEQGLAEVGTLPWVRAAQLIRTDFPRSRRYSASTPMLFDGPRKQLQELANSLSAVATGLRTQGVRR